MVSQNLMPAYRLSAKKRRKRLRRWLAICAGYALLVLVSYGVAESVLGSGGRAVNEEFERTKLRITDTTEQIAELQQKLIQAQRLQAANRVLADQPDWSLLLATLSQILGDDIVLGSCNLKPVSETTTPFGALSGPATDPQGGFVLDVRGFGRGQTEVSEFVLRLEETKLFREVKPIKSTREVFLNKDAVAFHLECLLLNRGEVTP